MRLQTVIRWKEKEMELKEIEQIVQTKLSEKRFYHSQCVMERAKELAKNLDMI